MVSVERRKREGKGGKEGKRERKGSKRGWLLCFERGGEKEKERESKEKRFDKEEKEKRERRRVEKKKKKRKEKKRKEKKRKEKKRKEKKRMLMLMGPILLVAFVAIFISLVGLVRKMTRFFFFNFDSPPISFFSPIFLSFLPFLFSPFFLSFFSFFSLFSPPLLLSLF